LTWLEFILSYENYYILIAKIFIALISIRIASYIIIFQLTSIKEWLVAKRLEKDSQNETISTLIKTISNTNLDCSFQNQQQQQNTSDEEEETLKNQHEETPNLTSFLSPRKTYQFTSTPIKPNMKLDRQLKPSVLPSMEVTQEQLVSKIADFIKDLKTETKNIDKEYGFSSNNNNSIKNSNKILYDSTQYPNSLSKRTILNQSKV
jgi:hypothetical protein